MGSSNGHDGGGMLDVFEFLRALKGERKLLQRLALGGLLLGGLVALLMPVQYAAKCVVSPPQQGQQSMMLAMMSQVSGLGAVGGGLGLKNPNDQYIGFLASRTVMSDVATQFGMKERYGADDFDELMEKVSEHTSVRSGKDGMIAISFIDRDPKYASDVANAYVGALQKLLNNLAVSNAAKKRIFFERESRAAKDSLSQAEIAMKNFQKQSGVIEAGAQMEGTMGAMASIRAEISVREVQIQAMRTYLTPDNPQIHKVQSEIAGLKSQMKGLLSGSPSDSGVVLSMVKAPDAGLEYLRRKRDVMYFQALFEILAKQYEIARIEEANESGLVQVVDPATPPNRTSGVPRPAVPFGMSLLAVLLGVLWIFFRQAFREAQAARTAIEAGKA